jgi:outer membrane protein assembly factor BamB
LDAATGRKRWESTVPSQADSVNVSLVSASPAVVHVQESGKRGTNNLLFFDGSGQVRAKILTNAPDEPFDTSPAGFTAVPLWKLLAGNGVFVATTRFTKGHYSVIGFDLNDGRRLWSKTFGSSIEALQVDGNQVLVVTGSSARPELHVLSLRDGKQQGDTQVLGLSRMSSSTALYVQRDYYVFVGEKGYSPWYHPLGVTKRK